MIFKDVLYIAYQSRNYAYKSVNYWLLQRNWYLGKRIIEEEIKKRDRKPKINVCFAK